MPFHIDNVNLGGEGQIRAAMQVGEDIRKWRQEREQTEKELGFADTVMKSAHVDGRISDQEYTDYLKMPEGKKHSAAVGQMANVADDFKRQQLAETILARKQIADERNAGWTPDPATLQRAEAAGLLYAPNSKRSGQYIDVRTRENLPAAGAPVYDDEGNQLGVYDAKGKITKLPSATKTDPLAAQQEMMHTQELQGLDRQIADMQAELASGNKKYGPDWNPLATPIADQLRGLLVKRAGLTAGGSSAAPRQPAAAAPAPKSATTMDDITGQTPLPNSSQPSTLNPQPAPTPVPTAPVVNSEQDYAAIPSGGTYVDARDGKLKRKKAVQ